MLLIILQIIVLILLGRITLMALKALKAVSKGCNQDVDGEAISNNFRRECLLALKWTAILLAVSIVAPLFS